LVKLEGIGATTKEESSPKITLLPNGEFVVGFSGIDADGTDASFYVQKFTSAGVVSGSMVKLESPATTVGTDAQLDIQTIGSTGAYIATWTGNNGTGSASNTNAIYVQKFNADGTKNGAVTTINRAYTTQMPKVVAFDNGDYAVAWIDGKSESITYTGYSGTKTVTSSNSIYLTRFSSDGTAQWTQSYFDAYGASQNWEYYGGGSSGGYLWYYQSALSFNDVNLLAMANGTVLLQGAKSWTQLDAGASGNRMSTSGTSIFNLKYDANGQLVGASTSQSGGSTADSFNGSSADETFTLNGGADVVSAGGGNDTIILNTDNVTQLSATNSMMINGGTGANTLTISNTTAGTGTTLDLTNATVLSKLSGISSIDITGPTSTATNNTLKLNWAAVATLSGATDNSATTGVDESKMLVVSGNSGDILQVVSLENWYVGVSQTAASLTSTYGAGYNFVSGHTYKAYTLNGATLFVDQALTVNTTTATTASTSVGVSTPVTIESLFGSAFSDADGATPNGTFKGVAITSAGTTAEVAAKGKYQISSNNGTTWIDLAGGLADSSAIYASKTSLIRYIGAAGVEALMPQTLTARLVDLSGESNTASLVTGNTINVSVNGGSTAFSGNTISIKDLVAPLAPAVSYLVDDMGLAQGNFVSGVISDDDRPVLLGQSEAGATVELFNGGVSMGTVLAGPSGGWTYSFASGALTDNGTYSITAVATDAAGNISSTSTAFTFTTALNDAPVLTHTPLSFNAVSNSGIAPTGAGAVGTLVSALVDGVTDVDTGALKGIAITGVDTTKGTLWYSLNGGTTWTAITSVSDTNAFLLAADSDNRVFFQPQVGATGLVSAAMTFRAWDQTSGTEATYVNASSTGARTAFSSTTIP
jgi:hypothetical protein